MVDAKDIKKDIKDLGSNVIIGGMGALVFAGVTDDTTYPTHQNTIDEAAVVKTVEGTLANRPDPKKITDPKEFFEADKEWVKSIAQNTLKNKEEIQQERDAPKNAADDRKTKYMLSGMAGGALATASMIGWRNRQEKKKAEKAAQGNDGKNV